jgi:hypothetical protein
MDKKKLEGAKSVTLEEVKAADRATGIKPGDPDSLAIAKKKGKGKDDGDKKVIIINAREGLASPPDPRIKRQG